MLIGFGLLWVRKNWALEKRIWRFTIQKINLTKLLNIDNRVIRLNDATGTTGDAGYILPDIGTSVYGPYSFEIEDATNHET